jgi:hypothetical protein
MNINVAKICTHACFIHIAAVFAEIMGIPASIGTLAPTFQPFLSEQVYAPAVKLSCCCQNDQGLINKLLG